MSFNPSETYLYNTALQYREDTCAPIERLCIDNPSARIREQAVVVLTEDVSSSIFMNHGDDLQHVWPKGFGIIEEASLIRGISNSQAFKGFVNGRKINQLLSRMSSREVGEYLAKHHVPGIFTAYLHDKRELRFDINPVRTGLRSQSNLATVSSPLRSIVDLVNLANFSAHVFGEELPYQRDAISELLADGRNAMSYTAGSNLTV